MLVALQLPRNQLDTLGKIGHAARVEAELGKRGLVAALEFHRQADAWQAVTRGAACAPVQYGLGPGQHAASTGRQGADIAQLIAHLHFVGRVIDRVAVGGHHVHAAIQRCGVGEWQPDRDGLGPTIRIERPAPQITVRLPAAVARGGVDMPGPEVGHTGISRAQDARTQRLQTRKQQPEFVIDIRKHRRDARLAQGVDDAGHLEHWQLPVHRLGVEITFVHDQVIQIIQCRCTQRQRAGGVLPETGIGHMQIRASARQCWAVRKGARSNPAYSVSMRGKIQGAGDEKYRRGFVAGVRCPTPGDLYQPAAPAPPSRQSRAD